MVYVLVFRAVSVEPKRVLIITLKNFLGKNLELPGNFKFKKKKKSSVFAQIGSRIFHHSKMKPASELNLLQQYLFQIPWRIDLFSNVPGSFCI